MYTSIVYLCSLFILREKVFMALGTNNEKVKHRKQINQNL